MVPGMGAPRRATHSSVLTAALLFALLADPLHGQYRADAPAPPPRLGGALVLGGSTELPPSVLQRFVALAGGGDAQIVVLLAPSMDATERKLQTAVWRACSTSKLSVLQAPATAELLAAALTTASGLWLHGESRAEIAALLTPAVRARLQALIAAGGAVGANDHGTRALVNVLDGPTDPDNANARTGGNADLLPCALFDLGYDEAAELELEALTMAAGRPVGFGIEPETALVVDQRWLTTVGAGSVHALVPGSSGRPRRVDRLRDRRRACLLALARAGLTRATGRWPPLEPTAPRLANGALVIVGGGGLPRGLLSRFIELAGGPDAPLVYVPCEESEQLRRAPRFVDVLRRAGARDVSWIHTKDRHAANEDEKILAPLRRARGIWFGGGRQWNLVDSYQHTKAHELMHQVLARGGVIGGSSAGASIQCDYLARGNPLGNRAIMSEGYEEGLGFLTGAAVDQHFSQRHRQPDMTSLVNTYPQLLGIGIDESTALLVYGSVGEVLGRGSVFFYDRRKPVVAGRPDYIALARGARFELVERRVLQ